MSWFKSQSKKHNSIVKRRSATTERLVSFAQKFGLLLVLLVIGFWLGSWFFMSQGNEKTSAWVRNKFLQTTSSMGFKVENILIKGRNYTDPNVLLAIINTEKGDPIFSFDPEETKKRLQQVSWVKDVQVERQFPDTVFIRLVERTPMALWQREGKLSLIDSEGVSVTDEKLDRFKDLMILVGDNVPVHAPDFLKIFLAEKEIVAKTEAATLKSDRRWDLLLKSGAVVKLPEEDLVVALRSLAKLQEDTQILDKTVKTIDVRDPQRILVRTHPGAAQEYEDNTATGDAI